ncbi:hypothetical protein GYMLUDRAFT_173816 [Collybiopsis luxurians FD-317 M1]|uniref:Uncharacterized protein n=1 Tax=Collybiopsis luxurians FD-317 M1 TaxID=944289 RepID=A0A0D0B0Z8_9AGAR|nr:hypothetical protein GYMLUDRAFT_173816 [Collybiopsis luxurians FD-317 M1]
MMLVCDMPAARLLAGFGHYTSDAHPCSMCKTRKSNFNHALDPEKLVPRTNKEHRQMAQAWLSAQTEDERKILYDENGVRWSELLRLDYWDVVQNTVIDPMHGFYLGICRRHCRQIWGMNASAKDCDGLWEMPTPSEEDQAAAKHVYQHGSSSTFNALKAESIRFLALEEGFDYRRNKKDLLDLLKQSAVLGIEMLTEVRKDMEKLNIPSWMAAAPNHPGEASHGKLTADQWRTLCTVNLPITLIRLWGSRPKDDRYHWMLQNFMHLVTALRLASMRTMTEEYIQRFETHMQTYLGEIIGFGQENPKAALYPHTTLTVYQHTMLHFGNLLRRFGPVHSWRCFAFEQFNYILQNIPTNSRFGTHRFEIRHAF